jgi:hypothetical protein
MNPNSVGGIDNLSLMLFSLTGLLLLKPISKKHMEVNETNRKSSFKILTSMINRLRPAAKNNSKEIILINQVTIKYKEGWSNTFIPYFRN